MFLVGLSGGEVRCLPVGKLYLFQAKALSGSLECLGADSFPLCVALPTNAMLSLGMLYLYGSLGPYCVASLLMRSFY